MVRLRRTGLRGGAPGPGDGAREHRPLRSVPPPGGPPSADHGPCPYGRTAREERTAELVDAVRLRLAESGAAPTAGSVAAVLRATRPPLGGDEVLDTVRSLRAELVGAGPLERLLAAPDVTDVLVNGPEEVWVDRGGGLHRATGIRFADAEAVRRLAHRLATAAGRRLDDARPWVDARLPDGTRLHAVLPPIATGCTHISLRVCRPRPFTLDELTAGGALPPEGTELLAGIVRARLSLLVSGGTGSGKTTLPMYRLWKSSRSPPLYLETERSPNHASTVRDPSVEHDGQHHQPDPSAQEDPGVVRHQRRPRHRRSVGLGRLGIEGRPIQAPEAGGVAEPPRRLRRNCFLAARPRG